MTALAQHCRRGITIALLVVTTAAVANLPAALLGAAWLCALLAPATLIGLLPQPPRRPLGRAVAAILLQLAAIAMAHQLAGPLQRPAVLAGSILPPLAFVVARRLDGDATLGLFLGFCVLLVGSILDRPAPLLLSAFVLGAALQLRLQAHQRAVQATSRRSAAAGRASMTSPWLQGLCFGLLCGTAALLCDRALLLLPARSGAGPALPRPDGDGRRSIGLPDTFVLAGGSEMLDLQGELLLEVAALDGPPVPANLYLRSGFFELPGLDSWRVGRLAPEPRDTRERAWLLRRPLPGIPLRRLEILRHGGARNHVFVPPGLCTIQGMQELHGDARREWFRLLGSADDDIYEVAFQQQPVAAAGLSIDTRWHELGLLDLPAELDLSWFRPLLQGVDRRGGPLAVANAIVDVLQHRCRYERREPAGPHAHSLLNFLHGERVGFCMHFASAAGILLRMAGVPCRIGVGLYGGDATSRPDQRTYGSRHAHAWLEIPITGRGFVVLDPTPPSERGVRGPSPAQQPELPAAGPDPADPAAAAAIAAVQQWLRTPWPYLAVLLLVLLASQGALQAGSNARPGPAVAVSRPARRLLQRILRELARRGHGRLGADTLESFADRLQRNGVACPELLPAFMAYQEVRFGDRTFDQERQQRMARGLDAVRLLPPVRSP